MNKKNQYKKRQQNRKINKPDPPDQEILDSIGSPNAWTPDAEEAWLRELRKMSGGEIHRQFPPMKKPSNVGRRGKTYG